MKTIRHNTFETNSSSTHSITIINKNDVKETSRRYAELVVNGILYPGNLKGSVAYVPLENGYDDGWIVTATTRDQKAALLLQHAKSWLSDQWESKYDDTTIKNILNYIREKLIGSASGYSDVDLGFETDFDHYGEESDIYINAIFDENQNNLEKVFSLIDDHIANVVNNDDMIVRASNEPY